MSWSRPIAVLALLAALVTGCGFQPVHAPGGGLDQRLARVEVAPVRDRVSLTVRNALMDGLGAPERVAEPTHRIVLKVENARERVGIQADETASRINVVLITKWQLLRLGGDQPVTAGRGQFRRVVPYNVVDDDFASLVAERDAEKLAGRMTADSIRTRVLLLLKDG